MLGTIVNAGTVILGSIIGLMLHKRLPEKITTIVFQGIGLFTLFLGFTMAAKTNHYLIMIFSIVIGSIIGQLLSIDSALDRFSDYLKQKVRSDNDKFTDGLITAFLLFCMGSMTILGAFEEGLGGRPNLLLSKSMLDGFSSVALSAGLGIGVIFSVIPLLIYQGGLTLFAGWLGEFFNEIVIDEMSAVGGLILIGLGINILEIKEIKVVNMLPGLLVAVILAYIFL
ncbi:MAG: DUF554 domain-containing protein [Candidatus Marinimicrobia bacterium]|nr:DUF554 domain-containing protein [bacterium]MCG2714703.1 DUF554 domain-containing protein [Candidatus Neomarinimicrobiota bacterium]